jgi:hypothetical protein
VRTRVWGGAVLLGVVGFVLVWWVMPHANEPDAWAFSAKLVTFVCITVAVALFPIPGRRLWWLVVVAFVGFAGYVFPRVSYFYYVDTARAQADSFYTHLYLLTYPAIALTAGAAHRLGGGSSGRTLKITWSAVPILFSGFLDVMWQLVNPVTIRSPAGVELSGRAPMLRIQPDPCRSGAADDDRDGRRPRGQGVLGPLLTAARSPS